MKSLGWALPHPDCCLHKKRWVRRRHAQRDDHVKTRKEDSHLRGEAPEEKNPANTWRWASRLQDAVRAAPSVALWTGGPPLPAPPFHTLPSPGSACDAHNCWLTSVPKSRLKNSYLIREENRILKCWVQGNERQKQRLMRDPHSSEVARAPRRRCPAAHPGQTLRRSLWQPVTPLRGVYPNKTRTACCLF